VSFQRVVKQAFSLKNGTKLPAGTHLAVASDAISHDPDCLPGGGDPEVFDPFRYARLREDEANVNRYQFATTDETSLHFGHGVFACPGRFFASNEIKLILSHMLMMYDFKFSEGQSRPKNLCYEEACYPDPSVSVLMRRRTIPERDVADIILGT
jgi:ent-kaurene oxidase